MCKLYAVVEIENKKNAETFTQAALPLITKTDNHGLGIMRLGENGVHIQRWLEPPTIVRKRPSRVMLKYEKALKHQQNEEGKPSKHLYAIAVHGRFATCAKSLQNTHPFYRNGTALMHNGIISNAHEYDTPLSTCDSEALLTQYIDHKVRENNIRLTDALKGVGGYYAAIVFNNNGIIDIWRDSTASLYLAHVKDVGVVVATTSEIITGAARKCKAFITGIDEILPNTVLRWNMGVSPQIGTFTPDKPVTTFYPTTYDYSKPHADKRWWEEELEYQTGYTPKEWDKKRWSGHMSDAADVLPASDAAPLDQWAEEEALDQQFLKELQSGKDGVEN